jgi:hypothetical protein
MTKEERLKLWKHLKAKLYTYLKIPEKEWGFDPDEA